MGRLRRRVEKIEDERGLKYVQGKRTPQDDKQRWLESRRIMRNNAVKTRHITAVRMAIERMAVSPGIRSGQPMPPPLTVLTFEEVVEEIFEETRPSDWMLEDDKLKEAPSRELIERELALAIYRQEPGTADKVCPPKWRESFVAGDEMLERFMNIPDAVLAETVKGTRTLESLCEETGISQKLIERAVGPDRDEIDKEEASRRITEYMADAYFGETAYRVHKLLRA